MKGGDAFDWFMENVASWFALLAMILLCSGLAAVVGALIFFTVRGVLQ